MFWSMPRARPSNDVQAVLDLKAAGCTDREISSRTGVPINTIRLWRNRGISRHAKRALGVGGLCATCGCEPHDLASLPPVTYAYLLGVYLGDGCLGRNRTSWALRIALDMSYPGIIQECCDAVERIRGGRRPIPRPDSRGEACVRVESTWRAWICFFPQHGPGHKHRRKIELTAWQQQLVDEAPQAFLRGLIHTDGWRGMNRVHVKGKDYAYPRYQFSSRSDDIRKLFTDTCDKLGIEWRPWTRYHVSVARRESVALMDTFVGPKS
jgi:hypothetical protein